MNANYISRALCYHGQPLQKIWDDERGVEDLRHLNLTQPNYSVYQERQKYFTFQERAKRLKIHQFLARKASDLYDRQLVANVMEESWLTQMSNCIAQPPPFEVFLNVKDKRKACAYRMGALKQGDIVYATVQKIMANANRIMVKPLCTAEPFHFYLADIPIKAVIMQDHYGPLPLDKQGNPRPFATNDFVRCEVCNVSADVERLTLGMLGVYNKTPDLKLGLCELSELPKYYRQMHNQEPSSAPHYEDQLNAALEFENPNYDVLFQLNGLQPNENLTLMSSIKVGFPETEYAPELRQKQASQWAFRSVADGIEHFKNGQQVEAFQCLNKALNIDPRNVEGLVARGALYANRGSFLKGLKDFEKALMLNKYHVNARKYMGETLVALGRSYEEENRLTDAIKAYSDCLNLLPQHEQARISLDALQQQQRSSGMGSSGNLMTMQRGAELLNLANAGSATINIASSDESGSSSGSGNDSEDQPGKSRTKDSYLPIEQDKRAVSDALSANEFKLDDDETMSSVRRLLREASKHKKSKKKGKKKREKEKDKDREKERRDRKKSKSKSADEVDAMSTTEAALEMLKKIDYEEAYRLMASSSSDAQLRSQLQSFFKRKERSETPPPPPPPSTASIGFRKQPATSSYNLLMGPSTSKYAAAAAAHVDEEPAPPAPKFHSHQQQPQQQQQQQKLSFQIKKRPLQMDKFGLLRLVTPLSSHSHSRSRSRSRSPRRRSRSRSHDRRFSRRRSRSRSRSNRSRSRSRLSRARRRRTRSRSPSRSRSRSRTGSRSRSRSRSYSPARYGGGSRYRGGRGYKQRFGNRRSRSRSFGRGRRTPSPFVPRRTPSPFVPRRTPSPATRYRRTRSRSRSRSRSYSPRRYQQTHYTPRGRGRGRGRFQNRWTSDNSRYNGRRASRERSVSPPGDGPTIEEVDEMIREAQKERKQGIIESDKDILKKKATNTTPSDEA